jgi:hypothetical protein
MPQTVSRRPFTAGARFRSRAGACEICSGQNETGAGFSPIVYLFSRHYHSTNVLHQHVACARISERNVGTYQKTMLLRKFERIG